MSIPEWASKWGEEKYLKRLHSACCGMENDKIYLAKIYDGHASVKLPDGSWTAHHYMGIGQERAFFEFVEKLEAPTGVK